MKIPYSPLVPLVESYVAIYKIYILRNPLRNNEIFYVGQTSKPLEQRLYGHITETGGSNRGKIKYIKEIIDAGERPIIESIEVIRGTCYIDKMMVNERELYWIRYYLTIGCKLLNVSGISQGAKCHEYHAYISSLKRGETDYRYYYCGKTAGGYDVYDENKLKIDGFSFKPKPVVSINNYQRKEPTYVPTENIKYLLKMGMPIEDRGIESKNITEVFPLQPSWSAEFSKEIPPYESIFEELEMEFDNEEDYEDNELDADDSDLEDNECAELNEYEYTRQEWVNSLRIVKYIYSSEWVLINKTKCCI